MTTTDEEEISLYQDQELVINSNMNEHSSPRCVSAETESDTESSNNINKKDDSSHDADEDIDIEEFINQVNTEDWNKRTPLYNGGPISIHDACVHIIRLSHLLNLNKNSLQILLKELRPFFPSDCRLPKTVFMLFKMTDNDGQPEVYLRKSFF